MRADVPRSDESGPGLANARRSSDAVMMHSVRQRLTSHPLADIAGTVRQQVVSMRDAVDVPTGASVAVGCSSRGIRNYALIVGAVVQGIKDLGLVPFCFPAMGSHGSATAAGQAEVLARAGITEETMGCPIRSSLAVEHLGVLPSGMPVAMDKHAFDADAFVVVNRVKPHTEFTHSFESGLMKMIAIGMGKEFGATTYHRYFMRDGYAATIGAVVEKVTQTKTLLFGVGIAEDGYGQTSQVEVIPAERLAAGEADMLASVKAMLPTLPFDDIDVLVIDEMGKDISGSGFDTKVVGRLSMPLLAPDPATPRVKRIVVCDLTDSSAGNADGVGIADFITERLHLKIDREALYVNALAGSEPEHARIPMVLPTDQAAVDAAIATIGPTDPATLRLVHITNTRDLAILEVSSALAAECAGRADLTLEAGPRPLTYSCGHLTTLR
jgi:hypothetical protein